MVRALALRSGDPGFKIRSDHSLNLILAALLNSQLVCLQPVGILNRCCCSAVVVLLFVTALSPERKRISSLRSSDSFRDYVLGGSEIRNPVLREIRKSDSSPVLIRNFESSLVFYGGTSQDKKFRKSFGFLCVA